MQTMSLTRFGLDSVIFVCADVVALVIQAAGGGIASGSDSNLGGNIMLAGIIIQLGM